jgi:hypothetical protein
LQHWTPSFLKSHHPLTWNTWRFLQNSTKYVHNHEIQNNQHVIWTWIVVQVTIVVISFYLLL